MVHIPALALVSSSSDRKKGCGRFGSLTFPVVTSLATYSSDDDSYLHSGSVDTGRSFSHSRASGSGREEPSSASHSNTYAASFDHDQLEQLRMLGSYFWNGPGSGVLTRVLWLCLLQAIAPKQAKKLEWAAVSVAGTTAVCTRVIKNFTLKSLPHPIPRGIIFLERLAIPAGMMLTLGLIHGTIRRWRAKRRQLARTLNAASHMNPRMASGVTSETHPAIMVKACRDRKPETAMEYVEIFEPSLLRLESLVDWGKIKTSPRILSRFDSTHCELMRFAAQSGLHEAESHVAVEDCLDRTVDRIHKTTEWVKSYDFVSDKELKTDWAHLLLWTQRLPTGHPAFLIRLGQALRECPKDKLQRMGFAAITQVDRGVRKLLKNGEVDQMVVVLDCQDAPALQVTQLCKVLKSIATSLNMHYPGRLNKLYLVHVPRLLRWVIHGITPFVHPVTRKKLIVPGPNNQSIPPEIQDVINWGLTTLGEAAPSTISGMAAEQNGTVNFVAMEGSPSHIESSMQSNGDFEASTAGSGRSDAPSMPSMSRTNVNMAGTLARSSYGEMPISTILLLILSCILTLAILNGMKDGMVDLESDNQKLQQYLEDDM